MPPEVTVLMPCLNEEETLGACISKALAAFQKAGLDGEVLIADNGSTDRSVEIARQMGARVVCEESKGYGSALMRGIQEARGTYVVMGDADDSYDFGETPRFVKRLREGGDLVMGARLKGKIEPGAMPWHHRWIGNPVLSGILNLFFRSGISDAHCGLRGFRREAILKLGLRTTGMEFASEMVIKAAKAGLQLAEIPITLHPDGRSRPPHLRSFRDGWRHLRFMLLYCPKWLFMVPGSCLTLLGAFLLAWLVPHQRQVGRLVIDTHTMMLGSLCLILGYQILCTGLYAKTYALTHELDTSDRTFQRLFELLTLERVLIVGLLIGLAGLAVNTYVVVVWVQRGFRNLDKMRPVLLGSSLIVIGAQTVFASFFLGILGIRQR